MHGQFLRARQPEIKRLRKKQRGGRQSLITALDPKSGDFNTPRARAPQKLQRSKSIQGCVFIGICSEIQADIDIKCVILHY